MIKFTMFRTYVKEMSYKTIKGLLLFIAIIFLLIFVKLY